MYIYIIDFKIAHVSIKREERCGSFFPEPLKALTQRPQDILYTYIYTAALCILPPCVYYRTLLASLLWWGGMG